MGDVSNLGFDDYSHKDYLNSSGESKKSFHDNVSNLLNNYDGENDLLKEYELVAEGTAEIHPDYENWV